MRRPVSVKDVFLLLSCKDVFSFCLLFLFVNSLHSIQAASVAILPSALFVERLSLGARWVYLIQ